MVEFEISIFSLLYSCDLIVHIINYVGKENVSHIMVQILYIQGHDIHVTKSIHSSIQPYHLVHSKDNILKILIENSMGIRYPTILGRSPFSFPELGMCLCITFPVKKLFYLLKVSLILSYLIILVIAPPRLKTSMNDSPSSVHIKILSFL